MLRANLKSLFARKLRLTLAVVAIVLGVAFLSGAFVLTDSLGARFQGLFESVNQNVSVQVVLTDDAQDENPQPRLTQEQLDRMADLSGVSAISGDVTALGVVPFDTRDGDPVLTSGAPSLGIGVTGDDPFQLVGLDDGQWPDAAGEVAISRFTAEQTHAQTGDRLKVFLPIVNEAREFQVSGVVAYSGDRDTLAGETLVLFQLDEAQRLFYGAPGVYSGAYLGAESGVSDEELRDRVAALVPAGFVAKTGQQSNEDQANEIQEELSQLTTYFFGPFAIVAVIVGIFLIFNTFNIVVAQRARELALFRAMGASWGQVTGSVLVEALLVGIVGATLGLAAGVGLGVAGSAALTGLLNVQLPGAGVVIGATPVILAYTVGVLVTVAAAFIPAVRASAVPPLAAMRDVIRPDKPLRVLSIVGAALAVPGAVLIGAALTGLRDLTLPALLIGVGLAFLGVALLSPLLTRPIAAVIGRVVAWGISGKLGLRNAMRDPRRTAVTAAALMIGVTLVSTASVIGASFKKTIDDTVSATLGAEIIIQTNQSQGPPTGETGFRAEALDRVRELPGVRDAVALYVTGGARVDGRGGQFVLATDEMATARDMNALETTGGELRDLRDGELIADDNTAEGYGWQIGDSVPITLDTGGEQSYRLVGTFRTTPLWAGTIMLPESAVRYFPGPLANQGYVTLDDGADAAAVTAEVEGIMSDYPLVSVGDRSSVVDQANSFIDIALGIVSVLLGVAILIALLGIINTLLLSIYERTRELGMLRAVGLSRRGVTRMIGTESVVMAVFGCLLGIALGVGLGVAITAALIDRDFLTTVAIPWTSLVIFVVVAAVAGVVAALWPAIRASRLNVLEAIAYE
jgi:putative ABC transport system permease protein